MEETVNTRILALRTHLGLSQSDFATQLGITQVGVWRIETGEVKPRKTTLQNIVQKFGVSRDWLIDGVGEIRIETPQMTNSNESFWKDEAYRRLEEEVAFLRRMLELNFLPVGDNAGVYQLYPITDVRAAS